MLDTLSSSGAYSQPANVMAVQTADKDPPNHYVVVDYILPQLAGVEGGQSRARRDHVGGQKTREGERQDQHWSGLPRLDVLLCRVFPAQLIPPLLHSPSSAKGGGGGFPWGAGYL